MKKIILIGDSIRMGYDKYVKDALCNVAEVFYPSENCKFAVYTLRFLGEWKKKEEWPTDIDLVHFNIGLWDLAEMDGEGPFTPVEHYKTLIGRIARRIKRLFPGAKIVFATSTSVIEEKYGPTFFRKNSVIEQFNEAAREALADTDVIINDLYLASVRIPVEYRSDMTHFNTPKGTEYMGKRVVSVICRELDISPAEVNLESFDPEAYTDENIGY